ncbi:hypothetical protein B0H94_1184 [Salsuginibacillus halophilus]|uniref:Uncharacterized protein n=1 Tax=Salsuginibacillus halophilus TaxID=517424 RepID=A0A2P8H659_9BACI|nr:hypothetical protein [Salsuginibacillus halophilus]PSL41691.1 hypothetical protein B0H94_1184 [Salsuginibacillus halophilus]
MLEEVRRLFESEVTTYKISKESGVPENTVRRLRSGEAKLENATYKNIEALHNYYYKGADSMNMTIEKKKNGSHVTGEDQLWEYGLQESYNKKMAVSDVQDIMRGYETTWEADHEEKEHIEALEPGQYDVDEGDFTYYIKIAGE